MPQFTALVPEGDDGLYRKVPAGEHGTVEKAADSFFVGDFPRAELVNSDNLIEFEETRSVRRVGGGRKRRRVTPEERPGGPNAAPEATAPEEPTDPDPADVQGPDDEGSGVQPLGDGEADEKSAFEPRSDGDGPSFRRKKS